MNSEYTVNELLLCYAKTRFLNMQFVSFIIVETCVG